MKYEINLNKETSLVTIKVIFTGEEFDQAFENNLKKKMEKAEIKGFRKGKAPRNIYIKHYGTEGVQKDTTNDLVNSSYKEIVEKENLYAVSVAEVVLLDDVNDDEFGFKFEVYVFPEIDPVGYFDLGVKKEEAKVTKEDVDNKILSELKTKGEAEVVEDGVVENGSIVVFDFCGYVDDEKFEGGEANNYELEIGSNKFIPGFEEQMIGLKVEEEKRIDVVFPSDYVEHLKDKKAYFMVTVHEIKKIVPREFTDEYVLELNIENVTTTSQYEEYLLGKLQEEEEKKKDREFKNNVYLKLIELNPVNIPEVMIENAFSSKMKQLDESSKKYGIDKEILVKYQGYNSLEDYEKFLYNNTKSEIHFDIVLKNIARVEKIDMDEEEYKKEFEKNIGLEKFNDKSVDHKYVKENLINNKCFGEILKKANI